MARTPVHPGEVLKDEMDGLGLSADTFASTLGVPANHLDQVLAGKRSLTADLARRLARHFGTSAEFWMNLQSGYERDLTNLRTE
jgi:antitoxin HigA-1